VVRTRAVHPHAAAPINVAERNVEAAAAPMRSPRGLRPCPPSDWPRQLAEEVAAQVLETGVDGRRHDAMSGSQRLRDVHRGDRVRAGRGSGEKALLRGKPPRHRLRGESVTETIWSTRSMRMIADTKPRPMSPCAWRSRSSLSIRGGDVGLDPADRLDAGLLGGRVERDDPVYAPVVVSAIAVMPWSATRCVISPMRLSPSSRLNSEWT
jgi:hypothetical protein